MLERRAAHLESNAWRNGQAEGRIRVSRGVITRHSVRTHGVPGKARSAPALAAGYNPSRLFRRVRLFWIFRFTRYDGGFASAKAAYDSSFLLTSFSEPRRLRWDEVGADGTVSGTR